MVRVSRIFSGYFRVPMQVRSGTHPEMLQTFLELDKRRGRRVTLSEAKRKREIDLAVADEDYIRSCWTVRVLFSLFSLLKPDALQKTFVTE